MTDHSVLTAAIQQLRQLAVWHEEQAHFCIGGWHDDTVVNLRDAADACERLAQEIDTLTRSRDGWKADAERDARNIADKVQEIARLSHERDDAMTLCQDIEARAATRKAALRDLLDAIPIETATADPPLQAWIEQGRAALAEELS